MCLVRTKKVSLRVSHSEFLIPEPAMSTLVSKRGLKDEMLTWLQNQLQALVTLHMEHECHSRCSRKLDRTPEFDPASGCASNSPGSLCGHVPHHDDQEGAQDHLNGLIQHLE